MLLTGSLARKFSIGTLEKHCVLTHCTVGVVPDLCLEFSH